LFATVSPNYIGVGGLVARNSCFSEAGFVAKIFGWVGPVAKPVAKKNWAPSILSPDIAKAQTFKKIPPGGHGAGRWGRRTSSNILQQQQQQQLVYMGLLSLQ
jgi:hypothetical protein